MSKSRELQKTYADPNYLSNFYVIRTLILLNVLVGGILFWRKIFYIGCRDLETWRRKNPMEFTKKQPTIKIGN